METQASFLVVHDLFQPSVISCYSGLHNIHHLIALTRAELKPRPTAEDGKAHFRQNSEDNLMYTDIHPLYRHVTK